VRIFYEVWNETRAKRVTILPVLDIAKLYYEDSVRREAGQSFNIYKIENGVRTKIYEK
jgi:hypothetical protein